jgi:hypothetical protein
MWARVLHDGPRGRGRMPAGAITYTALRRAKNRRAGAPRRGGAKEGQKEGHALTVSEAKLPPGSRSSLKYPLGILVKLYYIWCSEPTFILCNNSFSRQGRWAMGVVIDICIKHLGAGGSKINPGRWFWYTRYNR